MHLSYAQNLEDYHLDLVLADVVGGTYVDVGGGHPVADNVSFYFYLKGWRGLIVEPQVGLAAAYPGIRPRDTVVSCLAGSTDGTTQFHIVEGLHGLSSAVKANAESARQYGATYRTEQRSVRRLSGLIDEAGLASVDFLKIDVEGAEADVLAGVDFARHRPKVIVVEAANPNDAEGDRTSWEPYLDGNGYAFAYFDGLNRFYVAHEHAALAGRFPQQVTPWHAISHLWSEGRALESPGHPDHALASTLAKGLMAQLAMLPSATLASLLAAGLAADKKMTSPEAIAALIGMAEWPGAVTPTEPDSKDAAVDDGASILSALVQSDRLRAGLGRIVCMYDGGHLLT